MCVLHLLSTVSSELKIHDKIYIVRITENSMNYETYEIKREHDKNKFVCALHIPFLRTLRPTAPFLPHTRTHTNIHKHTLIHTTVLFHKPTRTLEEKQ